MKQKYGMVCGNYVIINFTRDIVNSSRIHKPMFFLPARHFLEIRHSVYQAARNFTIINRAGKGRPHVINKV